MIDIAPIVAGDIRAGARLMRDLDDRRPDALAALKALFPHTGKAYVVGITGNPGAGKSTVVDALIAHYRAAGEQVGVIAVDPSPVQEIAEQSLGRMVNRASSATRGVQIPVSPREIIRQETGAARGTTTNGEGERTMDQDLSGDQVKVVQYTIISVVPNVNDETRVLVGPKTVAFTNSMTAADFTSWVIAINCHELDRLCLNRKYIRVAYSVQGRFAPATPDYAQEQVIVLEQINQTLRKGFNIPPNGNGDCAPEPVCE